MAAQKWRKFTPEYRREVVEKMKQCDNISALSRELGIKRKVLYEWKEKAERAGKPKTRPAPTPEVEKLKSGIAELEKLAGRQTLELDFFASALRRIEEKRRQRERSSGSASTNKSDK